MQSGREDTLEKRYAIKFCFKLGKTATETYGMLQTAYGPSCYRLLMGIMVMGIIDCLWESIVSFSVAQEIQGRQGVRER